MNDKNTTPKMPKVKLMYTATFEGPKPEPGKMALPMPHTQVEVSILKGKGGVWKARATATRCEFANFNCLTAKAAKIAIGQRFTKRISEWKVTDTDGYELSPEQIKQAEGESVPTTHAPLYARKEGEKGKDTDEVRTRCGKIAYRMAITPDDRTSPTCPMCCKLLREEEASRGVHKQQDMKG